MDYLLLVYLGNYVTSYQFNGPASNLFYESEKRPGRLNNDFTPKEWSKPINGIDQAAYHHDCDYYRAENSDLSSDEFLKLKNIADERMIARLENYTPNGLMERFIKFPVIKVLHAKIKFGMSINLYLFLINSFSENAKQIAYQLHKPIQHKFFRLKEIVHNLDEIWAFDLINFLKGPIYYKRVRSNYVLVIIDCFLKFC